MLDEIERLSQADVPDCLALARDRGWAAEDRLWRMLLEVGTGYGVRDEAGSLVGTAILIRYGRELVAVGMVLVAARYGGRGIGRRLMEHVLAEAGDATALLHATEYGRPLYEKLGFVPVATTQTQVGEFAPVTEAARGTSATAGSPEVRPAVADDLPAVLALDAAVCGAERADLILRLPRFAERLLVVSSGGAITGYASRWRGATANVIGPVIAETPEQARLLIGELAQEAAGPVRIELDDRHSTLREWAVLRGLAPRGATTVMVRGDGSPPGDRSRWFAPVTLAVG